MSNISWDFLPKWIAKKVLEELDSIVTKHSEALDELEARKKAVEEVKNKYNTL